MLLAEVNDQGLNVGTIISPFTFSENSLHTVWPHLGHIFSNMEYCVTTGVGKVMSITCLVIFSSPAMPVRSSPQSGPRPMESLQIHLQPLHDSGSFLYAQADRPTSCRKACSKISSSCALPKTQYPPWKVERYCYGYPFLASPTCQDGFSKRLSRSSGCEWLPCHPYDESQDIRCASSVLCSLP